MTDDRVYGLNDMVRCDCHDCKGCSDCCRGMDDTILVDPYDMHRLKNKLGLSFFDMQDKHIGLHIEDGMIVPHMLMGPNDACTFLDENGRCTIHDARPGICRIFPLGRQYEGEKIDFILIDGECPADKTKTKVKKWIDTPDLKDNLMFLGKWHVFKREFQAMIAEMSADEEEIRTLNMFVLRQLFVLDFDEPFYNEFYKRLEEVRSGLGML